ncbi:POTRA domain-containing protein [uncultured Paludibaculum sp.]|uniref:POTRA domain-containing protein n=1 Tax=uncultured Paludibaculum sp. TaxID=1765020 RepID=UPI00374CA553
MAIEFRGATRLRESVLRALIASRVGGPYDIETLRRDAQALKHTGRFSDVVWETEESRSGPIVRFVVVERPVIQSVEYQGNDTVTVPEILERFRLRKVNLRVETLFNEDELERAAATVRELVAERGHQNITVSPSVEPVWPPSGVRSSPPSTVKIIFRAEEQR